MDSCGQQCPQCGWAFDVEALKANACKKCKSAMIITSVSYLEKFDQPAIRKYIESFSARLKADAHDEEALLAIGICYLRMGLYNLSDTYLKKHLELYPAKAAGYFYLAISALAGKRPKISSLKIIAHIERLLLTAGELEPGNGKYEFTLAAVRYEYYSCNGLKVPEPTPESLLNSAKGKFIDSLEATQILSLMKVNEGFVSEFKVDLKAA